MSPWRFACALTLPVVSICTVAEDFRDSERPEFTRTISAIELEASPAVQLLDVRLREDFDSDPQLIPGATYRDPESLEQWVQTLNRDEPVVVYCVAGKWVSQKAATLLSEQGFDVRSLDGGLNAWRARGEIEESGLE